MTTRKSVWASYGSRRLGNGRNGICTVQQHEEQRDINSNILGVLTYLSQVNLKQLHDFGVPFLVVRSELQEAGEVAEF